jgi:O-methyltransferase
VPDGDIDALAVRMRELMTDATKRKAFGAAARAAAGPVLRLLRRRAAQRTRRLAPRRVVNRGLRRLTGYHVVPAGTGPARGAAPPAKRGRRRPDYYDEETRKTIRAVQPWTMTSRAKLHALIVATRHVVAHGIPGGIVECGVWRGGSMQAVARTLLAMGVTDRDLHLFDTFAGMPEPTEADRRRDGAAAADLLRTRSRDATVWAVATLEDVQAGMAATGYPPERVHFHPGRVEDTIPREAPDRIALLRLDTDWYASTRHELEHLYDRVPSGGVVLLDDYDYWEGARQAVDEFLDHTGERLLLAPMGSGRIAVKP